MTINSPEKRNSELELQLREHLDSRGWQTRICVSCGNDYFAHSLNCREECGRYNCAGYEFLSSPQRKGYLTSDELSKQISDHFVKVGYVRINAIPVIRSLGHSLLTGSAGQVNDELIFGEAKLIEAPMVLSQPVIRLHSVTLPEQDGFSTSFINIGTEHQNCDFAQYIEHLDEWLSILNDLGLYIGDLTLESHISIQNWSQGEFENYVIKVFYRGLEIGVLNYFQDVPIHSGNKRTNIGDCSFGAERLCWAINKTPRYFTNIGPIVESVNENCKRYLDMIRTSVLMVASGLESSGKGPGSKLKKLMIENLDIHKALNLSALQYYYEYWSLFIELNRPHLEVAMYLATEWDRLRALKLHRIANQLDRKACIRLPREAESFEEYMQEILRNVSDKKVLDQVFSSQQ